MPHTDNAEVRTCGYKPPNRNSLELYEISKKESRMGEEANFKRQKVAVKEDIFFCKPPKGNIFIDSFGLV